MSLYVVITGTANRDQQVFVCCSRGGGRYNQLQTYQICCHRALSSLPQLFYHVSNYLRPDPHLSHHPLHSHKTNTRPAFVSNPSIIHSSFLIKTKIKKGVSLRINLSFLTNTFFCPKTYSVILQMLGVFTTMWTIICLFRTMY